METTTYRVTGMTCGHCVHAVTEEVGRIPGVAAVDVDLATGTVSVTADPAVTRTAVQAAVEEAGYALEDAR